MSIRALRLTGIYCVAHPPSAGQWCELIGRVVRGGSVKSEQGDKDAYAADVAHAAELPLGADAKAIPGQSFNCHDRCVAEQEVGRIAKVLTGRASVVRDLSRGPKSQIDTHKLRALEKTFSGQEGGVSSVVAAYPWFIS